MREAKNKRRARGLGTVGDSFYFAERYLKKAGEGIGLPKKRNLLLKTEKQMATKLHKSRSGLRRLRRFMSDFRRKAYLDTKLKLIKERMVD